MATRKRVTPTSGNRPLALLRGRMRSIQREAEALLAREDEHTPFHAARSLSERLLQGSQLGDSQRGKANPVGRGEGLLSGFERELMKRLKAVLERLDLPRRRELEELRERVLKLEKRLNEQPLSKRTPKRQTYRRKP